MWIVKKLNFSPISLLTAARSYAWPCKTGIDIQKRYSVDDKLCVNHEPHGDNGNDV